ncbi:restriction endonuclease subunit S [Corynebacterium sp. HMSC076D02]|uniref:restriction endonuclease subunit S n=1 Tax=Corynebacterium sp. HMSC076D02 TaxID=1739439 RepID=UPI0008A20924|nr:restriction endonuclease subunit S [Corynebacterium sp. HMSC076D02]OFQ48028.1 hypothetical protein HMPREF2935_01075 [Corynebacterium sp. HMSC076D02]
MPKLRIREIGEVFDGPHATPKRREEGKYFLNISSLQNGRLILDESDFIDDEDFQRWTRRVTPRENDLLFSYETRLGEAALMPPDIDAALGRRMALLRPNPEVVDPTFLLYYWLSPKWQQKIAQNTLYGATVNRLPITTLPNWEITLPELKVQRPIGRTLASLDDKIVANQTSISRIDEILRALWQKELSLGNIDAPLSSLASFINGKAFTKGASGTGRVVVRIAEMNSGIGGKTVFSDFDADPDNEVNPGDLLFSWSGTLMTKRWPYDQAIVNQHIFKVVPNGQLDLWALRQAIDAQLEYFQMIAAGKATTMGHIKRGDLDQEVEVPAQMSEETNQFGNSLWELATSLEIQNLQLARTRDELLPLLMSGRITVGEAEDAADEAASES